VHVSSPVFNLFRQKELQFLRRNSENLERNSNENARALRIIIESGRY
jgi:hypothetical protein